MFENLSVTESFKNSIESTVKQGRLSHALVFEGADEAVRLSAAKETAGAIVCSGENKPCGECNACYKAFNNCHPDIHILFRDEESKMIKVDSIRDLRNMAQVFPNDGNKSVFIIHGAQFMNTQSQNALLKIFEEPSAHVSFILTCDSKASLLDTIISRATLYNLGEESTMSDENSEAVLKAGALIEAFMKKNEFCFIKETACFVKDKNFFLEVLEEMLLLFRDALILQSGGTAVKDKSRADVLLIKEHFTKKKTLDVMEKIKELISDVNSQSNHNLTVTRLSSVLYSIKNS